MTDYIGRQALLKDIEQYHLSDGKFQHWVEVQPSADVQPVRHGHWIYTPTSPLGFTCSECGKEMCRFNYCPHCGVRMDEVAQ